MRKQGLSVEEEKALGDELIAKFCREAKKKKMNVMMDLIMSVVFLI